MYVCMYVCMYVWMCVHACIYVCMGIMLVDRFCFYKCIHTSYILLSSLPSTHTHILTLRSMMVSITEGFVFKLDLNYVKKLTASSNQSAYAVNLTSLLLAEHKSLPSKFLYIHTYILLTISALYIHAYIHSYIHLYDFKCAL